MYHRSLLLLHILAVHVSRGRALGPYRCLFVSDACQKQFQVCLIHSGAAAQGLHWSLAFPRLMLDNNNHQSLMYLFCYRVLNGGTLLYMRAV